MGQRNMLCTSQMLDLEMDQQGQGHVPPEPCILVGNISDFAHPNIHPVLSASGNTSNLDPHHLPDHHDNSIFYGTQYNSHHFHNPVANLDFGGSATSNFYNPYMIPSSSNRMFPVRLNHGSADQLPSSSNHGINGVGLDEYERTSHFMIGARGSSKRKNAEGIPRSNQHINGSTSSSSSSSGVPMNLGLHQWDEQYRLIAGTLDVGSFAPPEYRGNGIVSVTEGGVRRSVRSRSSPSGLQMESILAHNHGHLLQGNYMVQPFHPVNNPWVEQQFESNGGDRGTSSWNCAPALPYLHGRSVNGGSLEIGNTMGQGYQEVTNNSNSTILFYPPPMNHQHSQQYHDTHHHHHQLPPAMQGMQGQNYGYQHQLPTLPFVHPLNSTLLQSSLNPSHNDVVPGPRSQRPFLPTGFRIYRPNRREVPQAAPEEGNRPRFRIVSDNDVAILEFQGLGDFIDHHSDMRLDIDHMSYEELLALEERIGNVNTGLTEEIITRQLKTRTHASSPVYLNLDEPPSTDQETETCIICQVNYENQEKIGTLSCDHEYHADCIRKWLLVKNVCPICKTTALAVDSKDG
ncbi:PREDICTED: uncharacterized protein LOC104613187 [Nelumbo nucifera]|uniref:RING-type E3 ubiquitin transferase n=2 Tax=Nelumbo nucifera TaxID=4432 RepID=A0A822XPH8_NELNU|nr:PREDICTED: uncharacterized protein LOC104613187 [Nelumbo nucifera]DAD21101.1 TPA_asm: hypothetical protein HUJ06_022564 [Nelumbo nucifera]